MANWVVAGGIVRNRDWVIERSVQAIRNQHVQPDSIHYLTGDNKDATEDKLKQLDVQYAVKHTGYPGYNRVPLPGDSHKYDSGNMSLLRNAWAQLHRNTASHLWIVDSDVLPDSPVLAALLALDQPIAGAWVPGCTPMQGWNGEHPVRDGKEGLDGKVFKATMLGGCYLLRKDFLDATDWRPWGPDKQGEDGYLARMSRELGFSLWADPLAACTHIMKRDVP